MGKWLALGAIVLVVFLVGILVGNEAGVGWRNVVPVADVPVKARPSFARDILPIFQQDCVLCHGAADAHNELRLDSYEGVMKGTRFGPVVEPGKPELSNLMAVLQRETAPATWMPYHRERLSPNKITNIKNWIATGAPDN